MKRFVQLALFFALSFNAFAQISISKWQEQPIVIDGNAADWVSNPRFFNAETNVQYEFRNDSQHLYIILKTTDRATQMQFLRAGFVVHLKIKTKPPTKLSIIFPAKKMLNMSSMMANQEGEPNRLIEKSAVKPEMQFKDSAFLDGFMFSKGAITSGNKDANSICFARSSGTREQIQYELQIPIRELYGNNYILETICNIPLQLQVTINDLSQSQNSRTQGRNGKRMSGGMSGGRPDGGSQRGMGGGMSGNGEMEGREMEGMQGEMGDSPSMQEGRSSESFTASKKSFSIDFQLSTIK